MSFASQLTAAVRRRRNPVVVGLDPRWQQLPAVFRSSANQAPTASVGEKAIAYERFCCAILDVVAPLVPAVKPQAAFFEQLGPDGMTALKRVIDYARRLGLLVILDGKRNDIGTTAEAYADGYLGAASVWQADALTISPYLGDDSLSPFVSAATVRGAGLFVLVKTSNPGGGKFQDLLVDGRPLYEHVAAYVEEQAQATADTSGYGAVGAVVGATYPEQLTSLRGLMPHTWLLVPGYGSQGATARDVAGAFHDNGLGAVVNNARGIIFAHERKEYAARFPASDWQRAVEQATVDMIEQLRAETSVGRL